jgi:4-amino-4-deoxy-L-arabinose transferase-like glycosyltransferase
MKFVLGFNLLLFLFRVFYVLYSPLDLTPEEAQYWDWSRHLDLSYYSKPPMVAYINFLTTSLLGNTDLAIRITPIVLSFLMSIFTYFFAKRLFDERVAIISSTLPQLSVGLAINSLLMTTDALLIFFCGLSLMAFWYALEKKQCLLVAVAGRFRWLCLFE